MHLLDSAQRLRKLDFSKAPWTEIRRKLKEVDWASMVKISQLSSTAGHSYMLFKLLPILEALVPLKNNVCGRSKIHRKQKVIWRKLKKIRQRMDKTISVPKLVKLMSLKTNLERELKATYAHINSSSEAKAIKNIKENSGNFFHYAKARQTSKTQIGPFINP